MSPVVDFGYQFVHVAADALVHTGKGILHTIVLNGLTTEGDCTVYDGVDNTGAVIAVLHLWDDTSVSVQPITLTYDCRVSTGIYLDYDGTLVADFTVTFV